jgi:hypothetical protein
MSTSVNLLVGAHAIGAKEVSDEFHKKIVSDQRYVLVKRQPMPPKHSLQQTGVDFFFPEISDIYSIDDIKIEITVKMCTKTDKTVKPKPGTKVGVVNNVLSSCIKDVKIRVNNVNSKCWQATVLLRGLKMPFLPLQSLLSPNCTCTETIWPFCWITMRT